MKFFESHDHKIYHISEMNITFIANWKRRTYENYLSLPNCMLEWKLNAILHENPHLVTLFDDSNHPLIRKYDRNFYDVDGEN